MSKKLSKKVGRPPKNDGQVPEDTPFITLDRLQSFLRTKERSYVICYEIPSHTLSTEENIIQYKSRILNALIVAAEKNGYIFNNRDVSVDALPMGDITYIKASVPFSKVTGGRRFSPKERKTLKPGEEGLIVEE